MIDPAPTPESGTATGNGAELHGADVRRLAPQQAREIAASFDLAHLPASFYADPYPTYHALREHEPVRQMPDGSWFLTRYDDVLPVYRDPRVFSSDKKKEFGPKYGPSPLLEHHTTSLVFNDPPLHTRVRRAIVGALSQKHARRWSRGWSRWWTGCSTTSRRAGVST